MGYDLIAKNKKAGDFYLGAFSFPVLLEACGYLFSCIHRGGQWYCLWGLDPRMPEGDDYPRIASNDGFPVTAEEAKIMARIARNFVAIQRSLPEDNRGSGTPRTQMEFKKEDLEQILLRGMGGVTPGPWPEKIRDDFTEKFEKFAEWAERSGGFEIR